MFQRFHKNKKKIKIEYTHKYNPYCTVFTVSYGKLFIVS